MATVLLIDDEATVRSGVRRLLRTKGHEVLEASNGREAIAAIRRHDLDLVITDINMPEADGIEVIMELRAQGSGVPIIAISGGGRLEKDLLLANAAMLGAIITLPKPFELDVLSASVDRALQVNGGL